MEQPRRVNEQSIRSLIDMGTKGHFPLFRPEWIEEIYQGETSQVNEKRRLNNHQKNESLTKKEKELAKRLIQRLVKHRTIERMHIVLMAMEEPQRKLFVKAFMKMVEGKILDAKPNLQ